MAVILMDLYDRQRRPLPNLLSAKSQIDLASSKLSGLHTSEKSVPADNADVVIALGGDGFMLSTIHSFIGKNIPIFGMNRGSVGFLMNELGRGSKGFERSW